MPAETPDVFLDFCSRSNIDSEVFFSAALSGVDGAYSASNFKPPHPEVLEVTKFARFGNSVVQMLNAIWIARQLRSTTLILPEHAIWNWGDTVVGGLRFVDAKRADDALKNAGTIRGAFFSCAPFREIKARASKQDFEKICQTFLTPRIESKLKIQVDLDPTTLVLHYRSGDLFRIATPHPAYTQPPHSFYQACVEHHRRAFPGAAVVLAFECRANPCVDAMENYLKASKIPYTIQSADLMSDLALLFSATTIAWGFGTFGRAISMLSSRLKTFYFFENIPPTDEISALNMHYRDLPQQVFRFFDRKGAYIPQKSWKNSPEQRQLMLDYPLSSLVMKEYAASTG